jgi:hypothetical protein
MLSLRLITTFFNPPKKFAFAPVAIDICAMNRVLLIPVIFLLSCGGKVSDEHRKQMLESMREQKIVKISEAEILSSALEFGKQILIDVERVDDNPAKIDSIALQRGVKVKFVVPGDETAGELEQQLIEAYVTSTVGGAQDIIQPLPSLKGTGYDTLLYSAPFIKKLDSGIDSLVGIWNIYLPKRDVVKQITMSIK